MRRMVKLNDLEDMAEPPLHGSIEASLGNQRPEEGNDMETEAGGDKGAPSLASSVQRTTTWVYVSPLLCKR